MNSIVFPNAMLVDLREELLANAPNEAAAIMLAGRHRSKSGERLLVREKFVVPASGYREQSPGSVSIEPAHLNSVVRRARNEGWSILLIHTHPFASEAWFSSTDDRAEADLIPVLRQRASDRSHAFAVLTGTDVSVRTWSFRSRQSRPSVVREVGRRVRISGQLHRSKVLPAEVDRSVRALGSEGQRLISSLTVGIVGLGGLGSFVVQELAHSGVYRFVLIDPDKIERTNLNRVVGSSKASLRRAKVHVAAELVRELQPKGDITTAVRDITEQSVLKKLLLCDVVFCCTDSHGSRAVLNQLAYQYMIPTFDLGVQVDAPAGVVKGITGRVQMLAPGLPCLVCQNLLDPELVRRDLMSETQRRADPYIVGADVPQPAVISLNGTVASLGVTMFLSALAGLPVESRHQIVLFDRGTVRSVTSQPDTKCVVCSLRGALGRGDLYPFPGRPDAG